VAELAPTAGTRPPNNKMQRTSLGKDGGSPLILVFAGPEKDDAAS
jgi:hypothetical protein